MAPAASVTACKLAAAAWHGRPLAGEARSGAAAPSVTMLSGGGLADSGGITGGNQIRARMLEKMVYATQQLKLSCACDTHLQGPGCN